MRTRVAVPAEVVLTIESESSRGRSIANGRGVKTGRGPVSASTQKEDEKIAGRPQGEHVRPERRK